MPSQTCESVCYRREGPLPVITMGVEQSFVQALGAEWQGVQQHITEVHR